MPRFLISALLVLCCAWPALAAKETFYAIGAAQVDITPDYPIRLSGYGARQKESEGIDQHIFAQALAIGDTKKSLAILITVDNVAVPAYMREEVAARLARKASLHNERFTLCSTHAHTAPMLNGGRPISFFRIWKCLKRGEIEVSIWCEWDMAALAKPSLPAVAGPAVCETTNISTGWRGCQ